MKNGRRLCFSHHYWMLVQVPGSKCIFQQSPMPKCSVKTAFPPQQNKDDFKSGKRRTQGKETTYSERDLLGIEVCYSASDSGLPPSVAPSLHGLSPVPPRFCLKAYIASFTWSWL